MDNYIDHGFLHLSFLSQQLYVSMYLHNVANLISLNILAVATISFLRRWLQERESTGYVEVCVRKDSDTTRDFNVTVEALSGTAQGEEKVHLLYIFHHCDNKGVIATILH